MPVSPDAPFDWIGSYTPVETINAKLEATTVEARSELAANACRMKGKTKAKEEIAAAGELFVLPPGLRPPAGVVVPCTMETEAGVATVNSLHFGTTGKVTISNALAAKSTLQCDGIVFNLT